MIRRYGAPVKRDVHYKMRPGAYAILHRAGSLLLTHQMEPEPEVQLPGGGVDPGESAIAALHREVYEETGWRIGAIRRFKTYRRFMYMPEYDLWAEKLCQIFIAQPVLRLSDPTEQGHTALWADIDTAMDIIASPADREILQHWANGDGVRRKV